MQHMTVETAITMAKAKLKCIQLNTTGKAELCNWDCDNCNLNYDQGNMGEQKEWLAMAIDALEKQNPHIPVKVGSRIYCISCFQVVGGQNGCLDYCPYCGQRIDWREEL